MCARARTAREAQVTGGMSCLCSEHGTHTYLEHIGHRTQIHNCSLLELLHLMSLICFKIFKEKLLVDTKTLYKSQTNPHYLSEAQFGLGKTEMFYIFVAKKRKEGKILQKCTSNVIFLLMLFYDD
jgi:hypothetical protein